MTKRNRNRRGARGRRVPSRSGADHFESTLRPISTHSSRRFHGAHGKAGDGVEISKSVLSALCPLCLLRALRVEMILRYTRRYSDKNASRALLLSEALAVLDGGDERLHHL